MTTSHSPSVTLTPDLLTANCDGQGYYAAAVELMTSPVATLQLRYQATLRVTIGPTHAVICNSIVWRDKY